MTRRKVAIVGAGMAGMAAAWRLSEPGWRERYDAITVYQRGHRLGGKGASSRGAHGRVEEHGLHVWLGYYDNAFRLMRECYDELDRPTTAPDAPLPTFDDAFFPADEVGLEDRHGDEWHHWVSRIGGNDLRPGIDGLQPLTSPLEVVRRATALVRDFLVSVGVGPRVHLGTTPQPVVAPPTPGAALGAALLPLGLSLVDAGATLTDDLPPAAVLDRLLTALAEDLRGTVLDDHGLRRLWQLLGLLLAVARGVSTDERVLRPDGLRQLNDEEFGAWLARHGAGADVLDSAMKRGLSDLVFGFEAGDTERPGFGAGLGVFLTFRTFLDYKGAIFWKMAAGMGETVFAPMYEVLRRRGVDFEFFHRLDALELSDDGLRIGTVRFGRQVALRSGVERYEPLRAYQGLPCFPAEPDLGQLDADEALLDHDLESHWCRWPDAGAHVLHEGVDFDDVVFAIPPAMARHTCRELVDRDPAWAAMVGNVRSVATQALQVWLRPTEPELGWPHPGSTVSAYVTPFDTWASMPQLIGPECWPDDDTPGTIAYFCSVLPGEGWDEEDPSVPGRARAMVRENARRFLRDHVGHLLPGTVDEQGFRWDLLCGTDATDEQALDSQYWRANVDPSDRYVQSLPGTDRHRLRPDESGFDNLFLAGDWTDCGLNAGCIEAATMSGLMAANAVAGRSRAHRIAGSRLP